MFPFQRDPEYYFPPYSYSYQPRPQPRFTRQYPLRVTTPALFNDEPDSVPITDEEDYYRHLADEHRRRAELALALAQEEHERARQREAQQARSTRLRQAPTRPRSMYASTPGGLFLPDELLDAEDVNVAPFDPYAVERARRQRELEAANERRRQEERQRQQQQDALRRLREQTREERPRTGDTTIVDLLAQLLGISEPQADEPAPQPAQPTRKTVHFGASPPRRHSPIPVEPKTTVKPSESPRPQVASQSQAPQERLQPNNFPAQLWNALSSGSRSDAEKESILRGFGLPVPSDFRRSREPSPAPNVTTSVRIPAENIQARIPSPNPAAANVAVSVSTSPKPTTPKPASPKADVPKPTPAAPATPPFATTSPNHSASFGSIDAVETKFKDLKSLFSFPQRIDFDHSSAPTPRLLYTSNNAPVNHYESELVKLLTKLDAIDSEGLESIRGARKALVLAIEAELDRVDALKSEAWTKTQSERVAESEVADVQLEAQKPVDVPPVESAKEVTEAVEDVPPTSEDASPVEVDACPAADSVEESVAVPHPEAGDHETSTEALERNPSTTHSPLERPPSLSDPDSVPDVARPVDANPDQGANPTTLQYTVEEPAHSEATLSSPTHSTSSLGLVLERDSNNASETPVEKHEEDVEGKSTSEAGHEFEVL